MRAAARLVWPAYKNSSGLPVSQVVANILDRAEPKRGNPKWVGYMALKARRAQINALDAERLQKLADAK